MVLSVAIRGGSMEHGHHDHHRHMIEDFRKRFFISIAVTIPVLLLSPLIQDILGFSFTFPGDSYLLLLLASAIFFYGGWPFLKGIYDELKQKNPGMMTLIAIAISVAYIYSASVVLGLPGKPFFWEAATLIDIMLLGHWIEMRSVISASRALESLAKLMPDTAHRKAKGKTEDVALSELKKGDTVLIKPGEKIPADGEIIKGQGYLDESMLTGESEPVRKAKGDEVIGGSVNGDSSLEVRVKAAGEESYLNKVIGLVNSAQKSKSRSQRLADRAARWLTFIAVSAGIITFAYWAVYGPDMAFAIERMVTVMVITCPHALGLAIPLVTSVSTAISAKQGLLIRNRTAFEGAGSITTVVFDKTGTLTEGVFKVSSVSVLDERYNKETVMQYAASVEQYSEHPVAKGIIEQSDTRHLKVTGFKALKGEGVEGRIGGKMIRLVSHSYLQKKSIQTKRPKSTGTHVFMLIDDQPVAVITLGDSLREDSRKAVRQLKDKGIGCWMFTGDNEEAAKSVSDELGLDGYHAELLPDQKLKRIKELQKSGKKVAMTGDGVNDAPALAQADIGIAIGSGTDVAAETADIILVRSNPLDVVALIAGGKATYRKMVQNLFWATAYNAVALPLAAGVLISYGIMISPALGAALMSLSTVIVAVNARLLRF